MFERLKGCADRINDQLGPRKASARSGSVDRHRALAPCAPGNPGDLQVRRAMGGGASRRAARLVEEEFKRIGAIGVAKALPRRRGLFFRDWGGAGVEERRAIAGHHAPALR